MRLKEQSNSDGQMTGNQQVAGNIGLDSALNVSGAESLFLWRQSAVG